MTPAQVEKLWRKENGCSGEPKTWLSTPTGDCKAWDGEAPFISCSVKGGHDWPTAPDVFERPVCNNVPMDFDVGETIWRFFAETARE